MQRRTFMQMAGASVLAASLTLRASGETPAGALSEQEAFDLDVALAEIEALGEGLLETVVPAEMTSVYEQDAAGQPVIRSVLTPDRADAVFPNPPITEELLAALKGQKYYDIPADQRETPVWPAVTSAPDYLHLAPFAAPPETFVLTADLLALLADRNSFTLRAEDPILVFGLRGCTLPDGVSTTGWVSEQQLNVSTPTHLKLGCTMGLWRRSDGMIALFRAGTVPAVHYMFMGLAAGGSGISLLPTGLYEYARGDHWAGKPNSIQRGALLIQDQYPVLRTAATLSYNPFLETTAWTRGAGHNIHAAGPTDAYWSAGCQVIEGNYVNPDRVRTTGAWRSFRLMAGTVDTSGQPPAGGQKKFQYMLLTGREAALAYHGASGFAETYRPLRFGSAGARVAALQARFLEDHGSAVQGLKETGKFDMATSFAALIDSKVSQGDFATPISA